MPGEPIAGYLTRGRGVSVHRPNCAAFQRLAAAQPQRVLPVEWGRKGSGYEVDVEVLALDRKWLLKEVTNAIAQGNAHVTSIHSEHERNGARVRLRLRLRVADYGQLSTLLGKLSALPGRASRRTAVDVARHARRYAARNDTRANAPERSAATAGTASA